jgi:hypothetical protein
MDKKIAKLVERVKSDISDEKLKQAEKKVRAAMENVDRARKIMRNAEQELEVVLATIEEDLQ